MWYVWNAYTLQHNFKQRGFCPRKIVLFMKVEMSALQIAIAQTAVESQMKEVEQADFSPNSIVTADFLLGQYKDLLWRLEAAYNKALKNGGK